MDVKLTTGRLDGRIKAIAAKSHLHRVMICSALADQPTEILGKSKGADVHATRRVLEGLGASIFGREQGYIVLPIEKPIINAVVDAGESGSTLRFLLPVAAALGSGVTFEGAPGLARRPIKELLSAIEAGGASVYGDCLPVHIVGKLKGGDYIIRGDISSQYLSGLMFALPIVEEDSRLIVEGVRVSTGYIDLTMDALAQFGVEIVPTDYGYFIKGGQKYRSSKTAVIEGDWSNAAFWFVGGAINGDVTVEGLNLATNQGDSAILDLLEEMGATVLREENSITVKKSSLKAIRFDAEQIPDLVPVMAIAAACANGVSEIYNVHRLVLKESDRISAIASMLRAFGISCSYSSGVLTITGGALHGGRVSSRNDHRIAMSAAIGALVANGETTIVGAEAVGKSYEDFFADYAQLGGKIL